MCMHYVRLTLALVFNMQRLCCINLVDIAPTIDNIIAEWLHNTIWAIAWPLYDTLFDVLFKYHNDLSVSISV